MRRIDRQPLAGCWIVLDVKRNQLSARKQFRHQMVGHAASSETAEQEVQAPAEIHEAPMFYARKPKVFATGVDRV